MQAYSANQSSGHRSIAHSIASAAVGCSPSNARMPRSSSQTSAAQHRPGKEKRGVVMLEPGDWDAWLHGTDALIKLPPLRRCGAGQRGLRKRACFLPSSCSL